MVRFACLATYALVVWSVWADFMASVTLTPLSWTETEFEVAVLFELAVNFRAPAPIEKVPPRWAAVEPPAVTSGWSTLTSIPLTPMSRGSTVALLVELALPVTEPDPTEILPDAPWVGAEPAGGPM